MRRVWIAGILVAVLVIGTVGMTMAANYTCPACSATDANKESNEELKLPEELTKEDLQKLYKKYNITENDIKFAKGELPHYLDGTILDGKVVTMGKVTKDGKVENWIDPLFYKWCVKNRYKVIPAKKALEVEEKARERYIKKYDVDPTNPKIDVVNGILLPREYVEELVRNRKMSPGSDITKDAPVTTLASPVGPYAKYDKLYLWIFAATDSLHKPQNPYLSDVISAYSRFYQFNPGTLYYYHITDYWDASDVPEAYNITQILYDLEQDTNWVRTSNNDQDGANDIVQGWVNAADHNGIARKNGFFSVGATVPYGQTAWPHDSIAQHEISHNFNAADQGTWWYEHPECIMNYWYAFTGTDIWCTSCGNTVNGNINGQWE